MSYESFPNPTSNSFSFPIKNGNLEQNNFSVPCKSLQWSWVCLGKMFSYAWLDHSKDVWFGKYHVNKILFRVFPSMGILFCLFYLSFTAHSFSRPSSFSPEHDPKKLRKCCDQLLYSFFPYKTVHLPLIIYLLINQSIT